MRCFKKPKVESLRGIREFSFWGVAGNKYQALTSYSFEYKLSKLKDFTAAPWE